MLKSSVLTQSIFRYQRDRYYSISPTPLTKRSWNGFSTTSSGPTSAHRGQYIWCSMGGPPRNRLSLDFLPIGVLERPGSACQCWQERERSTFLNYLQLHNTHIKYLVMGVGLD